VLATDLHVQATYRLTEALVAAESRATRRVAMLSEIVFETDAAGLLVFLNEAWARALGYPVCECLGKPLSGFVVGEDREELGRVMAAGPVGTGGVRPRIRIPRMDGKMAWMEVTAAPLPDGAGVVGALHDVTAEKEAQDELSKLSLVASYTDNFVIITDREGRTEWVNQAFVRRTGYTLDEMRGRKPGELLQGPETDRGTVAQIREWLSAGKSFGSEILNYTRSGDPYWVAFQITPIRNAEGVVERYVAIQTESTALRQARMELQAAKERAESASEAKTQFLATISHEMRTPLNVILGTADLLMDGSLDVGELSVHLNRINASAEALLRLITDMLDLSKIEAGQFDFERVPMRLRSVLEAMVVPVGERARAKGLEFGLTVDPALPSRVMGDPDRLRQIVTNLAENAVKFTDSGSVRVDVSRLVPVPGAVPQMLVRVMDTGTGIAPEFQARIFARFEQVDGSTTRRKGGAGLGLNIVKTLVEAMGGTVSVQSQLGAGSEFRVILPLDAVSEVEVASGRVESASAGSAGFPGGVPATVLVAEDTEANYAVARIFLTTAGYVVMRANNGREAVEMSRAADLILMDIEMPEMDGLEATRRIRAEEKSGGLKPIPILALTGHAVQGYRERCLAAGCTAYLTKPIRKQSLVDAVRVALEAAAAGAAGGALLEDTVVVDPDVEGIVPEFLKHCGLDVGRLRRAMGTGDWAECGRVGHGMKGAALTMGFARVAELSSEIVQASRELAGDRVAKALEVLEEHLSRVKVVPAG
jgi:hypothetical protein